MTAQEILRDFRARGVDLRLSDDLHDVQVCGGTDEDTATVAREKLWLLMLLTHEAGGDLYDPRLAFLASAEHGLTRGAIATRMQIAFGIDPTLAHELINLALTARYLVPRGGLYYPEGDVAAVLAAKEALPA